MGGGGKEMYVCGKERKWGGGEGGKKRRNEQNGAKIST